MKEPLVFLPGAMCDARVFGPQITAFSPDQTVIVAPITGGERIEEIASGLLSGLPHKFALMGLSMGGMVAMEILRRAPERVTRIALMSTNALAETPQTAADFEPMIIKLRAGQVEAAVEGLIRPEALVLGPDRTAILSLVVEMANNLGVDVIINQLRALQRRQDYQGILRRCKVPALVLCGEQDKLTSPRHHAFLAELIPDASLAIIEGAGHLPVLEQPDLVNDALRAWMA